MQWLENKIPPPIIALSLAVAMWKFSHYFYVIDINNNLRVIGAIVFLFCGFCIDIVAIISFRRAQTTINPIKPQLTRSLVTSGIYQYCRNPMYLGLLLFLVAWMIYLASPLNIIFIVTFLLYINRFQIMPEEKALTQLFGEEFLVYKSNVPRWL